MSVVIPAFNEEDRLGATLDVVVSYLRSGPESWELTVVDDGSTDATAALVERIRATEPRVRLIRTPVNRGKGHAVRSGVLASRGSQVLVCDADLATPIHDLPRLQRELGLGASAAIGSRVRRAAGVEVRQRPVRRVLGRIANWLIRAVGVPGISDTQCGFKLFDGNRARLVFAAARINGWGFDVEILRSFCRRGWLISEVPVRWSHRAGSKLRPTAYLAVLAELARMSVTSDRERYPAQ